MFGILDAVIIVLLLGGIVFGAKRGFIHSAVEFVGIVLVLILSFILKNPVADLLFNFFPFIDFKDAGASSAVLNILLYETIAFVLVFTVFELLFKLVKQSSKIIQKILDMTIIGGILSDILGAIVGFIEAYILTFMIIYIVTLPLFGLDIEKSKMAKFMIEKTPVLNNVMDKGIDSLTTLSDITLNDNYNKQSDSYNIMAVECMLKGGIITTSSADILVKKGKLPYKGIEDVINKYRK